MDRGTVWAEVVRGLFSAPFIFGGLIFYFLWKHGSLVGEILKRISSISLPGGVIMNTLPATAQETAKSIETLSTKLRADEFDNAVLVKYEARARDNFDARQLSPVEKEKIIIRYYVGTMLSLAFERIHKSIWGSQLSTIQDLNTLGEVGIEEVDICSRYYEPAKLRYPEIYEKYSFEQWLSFLTGFELASKKETKVVITPEGKEFLKYLIDQSYSFNKIY